MTARRMEQIFTTIPQSYRDRALVAWHRHGDFNDAHDDMAAIAHEWLDSTCGQPGLW